MERAADCLCRTCGPAACVEIPTSTCNVESMLCTAMHSTLHRHAFSVSYFCCHALATLERLQSTDKLGNCAVQLVQQCAQRSVQTSVPPNHNAPSPHCPASLAPFNALLSQPQLACPAHDSCLQRSPPSAALAVWGVVILQHYSPRRADCTRPFPPIC